MLFCSGADSRSLFPSAGFATSRRDPDFITKKLSANDPFEPETVQNWADMFALNTITPFFVVRAFQSLLIKGAQSRLQGTSSVINISGILANLRSSASGHSVCTFCFFSEVILTVMRSLLAGQRKAALKPSHPSSSDEFCY